MTTLTSPHDLLTAIPFLVGFQPEDSIILISLKQNCISMAMRIDLPDQLSDQIEQPEVDVLISHLIRDECDGVIAVFYLPNQGHPDFKVIDELTKRIATAKIELQESILVQEGRWRSLLCSDYECCPASGNPMPEIESSRIAAEQVALGKPIPFANLRQMVDSLSALPIDEKLLKEINVIEQIDYQSNPIKFQRQGAEAVLDFISDFTAEGLCRDNQLIALVLVRLQDLQVRDFALGSANSETLPIYFDAWRWLLRLAPEGYVAPVANLFAAAAYESGDGAMAQRALDRAFEDQPSYALTGLLRQVFSAGWPPTSFSAMRAELHPRICESLFSGNINS